jgi:hypothetical protein
MWSLYLAEGAGKQACSLLTTHPTRLLSHTSSSPGSLRLTLTFRSCSLPSRLIPRSSGVEIRGSPSTSVSHASSRQWGTICKSTREFSFQVQLSMERASFAAALTMRPCWAMTPNQGTPKRNRTSPGICSAMTLLKVVSCAPCSFLRLPCTKISLTVMWNGTFGRTAGIW